MSAKLHALAWQLKLLTYFLFGLIVSSLILVLILKKPGTVPTIAIPSLPANLPPAPEYEWSPDFTRIAFQRINSESEETHIIVWNTKTNTSSTVATLNKAEFWVSDGQVDLAWLGMNTLAYARLVTDDSLPNWEIIGTSSTPEIWNNRDIISFSPDRKKLLTVTSKSSLPSESLEYEVIQLNSQKIISTPINAHTITCSWFENTSLKCYYTSKENKIISFIVKITAP